MQLENKTIVITGASSGIGAAAASLFAANGANLVLGARRGNLLEGVASRVHAAGGRAVSVAGDVRRNEFAEKLVAVAVREFGGIDGAFNNAGIMGDMTAIPDMDEKNWHQVVETNLTSAFYAARHQIPAMKARGGGSIVFTSSFVGNTSGGMSGMGAYAASKAGQVGLVKSLAAEHGRDGIRVNALLPGGTKTDMAGDDPATHEFIAGLHSLGRMASPTEIAQAAMFLLSDQAAFVSGAALLADGGVSIRLA